MGFCIAAAFGNRLAATTSEGRHTTSRAKSMNETKHFLFRLPYVAPKHITHFWHDKICMGVTLVTYTQQLLGGIK